MTRQTNVPAFYRRLHELEKLEAAHEKAHRNLVLGLLCGTIGLLAFWFLGSLALGGFLLAVGVLTALTGWVTKSNLAAQIDLLQKEDWDQVDPE